ncbi:MAG TPA: hypothetical protein VL981_04880 [Candidatus Methylacidiphilales bacterium]|nr:hypothetical protein [Candidatus Methylacidiphilales bacterium]
MPLLLLFAILIAFTGTGLFAQESATGSIAAPPPASQTSGLLTPPSDMSAAASSSNTSSDTAPSSAGTPTSTTSQATKTGPTSTSTPMTREEIARANEQEIIRRQDLMFRANEALSAGRKAEVAQNYPEARKNYLFCVEAYGSISRATLVYAKSAEGLTRVDFALYDDALKRGDTKRAQLLIDEVVQYNPNNRLANQKLMRINHALANPNDTSMLGNPAVTPGFVDQVNQVEQLLALAEQYRRTGQWDQAESTLKKILAIDPYNGAATKQLERINTEKSDYAEHARLETREERLRNVEENWFEPIYNNEVGLGAQAAQPTLEASTTFNIDQKLKTIFVSLDFDNATIDQATTYLSLKSKDADPDKRGVDFVIDPGAETTSKPITLTLNNVPLGEALRYVCQLANVKYKVENVAISIVPSSASTDELISRTFIVQPSFVAPPMASSTDTGGLAFEGGAPVGGGRPLPQPTPTPGAGTETTEDTVLDALKAKGLLFPPGSSAVYTPATQQLTVVDTADQMEFLEELVYAGQAPTLMVRVATKFVEINQNDLNDLTVNTAINFNSILNQTGTAGVTFTTAMPGARALAPDSIDALISPVAQQFNQLAVRGFIDHTAYNMVFDALSQKRSFDLLTEPTVLTKSGEQGTVEDIRVFPYPIAFDPPQFVTPIQFNNGAERVIIQNNPPTVIPATPTDFKRRNIGVRLVVRPQIAADNKTIDLSLVPEVTDFEGFVNYGSPIQVVNPQTTAGFFLGFPTGTVGAPTGLDKTSLLTTNDINQPVFNTRRINTKVLISDGSTVVLGGLMRDDVETVNDSVPILGDLPLIGRLFRSKAIEDTKKNLLIFVTASIYQNDGELRNPPQVVDAADVLTGHATVAPVATP